MITAQEVERKLMEYLEAVGGARDRTFSVRDFDSQVMMNAFTPEDRAVFAQALAALSAADILARAGGAGWQLTPKGLDAVRAAQESRRESARAVRRTRTRGVAP